MRQFILQSQIPKDNLIVLKSKDFRYLRQVLRSKTGDTLNVRTKEGILCNATVLKIDDKLHTVTLKICNENSAATNCEINNQNNTSDTEFWLFQFLPRPQKFEQIVRQATECGINKIIPVLGEYSEKSSASVLENQKKERIEKIIKEARQQSGSPVQTKVVSAVNLEDACKLWQKNLQNLGENQKSIALVLSEHNDCETSLFKIIETVENHKANEKSEVKSQNKGKSIKKIALAIGSEGGISLQEIQTLKKCGFIPIHFNVNILRCETAALYGIAAVQSMIL